MSNLEGSLRADSFSPGVPLELLNGETFQFEPPVFRGVYPAFGEGGKIIQAHCVHFGPEWEECLNSAESVGMNGGNVWPYVAWLIDRMLTHRNYRPEIRDHYRDVIYYNNDDEKSKNVWRSMYDIALGISPKGRSSIG